MIAGVLDAILVLVVAEGLALTLLHRRTGRGPEPRALWPNLAAGFLLLASARVALGRSAPDIARDAALAALLLGALAAHAFDLGARWRERARPER